jgi:ribulose-5-phosphate 4-epimerase/fuculose-1-phosphate aldolase
MPRKSVLPRNAPNKPSLADVKHELAVANRMCAYEGVLDAFGHVSVRHPDNPNRYFLSRSRAPELVEPNDFIEFDLDSEPVVTPKHSMYSERVIHGEIYKARPDVMSVCHHHSPAILSYCITGEKPVPVYHLGSVIGQHVPFWDQREEFGDTNLLVRLPEEGASLARALGNNHMVLMRRHGATVVGKNIRELVFRTIYSCRNAEYQTQAKAVGQITHLSPGEIDLAGKIHEQPNVISRAWEYWDMRLAHRGATPPRGKAARAAPPKTIKKARKKSR